MSGFSLLSSAEDPGPSGSLSLGAPVPGPSAEAITVGDAAVVMRPRVENRSGLYFRVPVERALAPDAPLRLGFTLQALEREGEEAGEAGQAGVVVRVGRVSEGNPDNQILEVMQLQSIALASGDPQRISIPFQAGAAFAAGEMTLQFASAYFEQPVRVSDIRLEAFAPGTPLAELARTGASYPGQAADAAWRERAASMIAEHRSGPLRVRVVDAFGRPVEGAEVRVEMTRHAFPFGTAIAVPRLADDDLSWRGADFDAEAYRRDNEIYRQKLKELFNFVVFENGMKWPQWWDEKAPGAQDRTLSALHWLGEEGFTVKGHTMVWGSWRFTPERLNVLADDPDALQRAVLAHIRDLGHATRGRVAYFDVLNEPMSHRDLIEILGAERVAEWFRAAREALPGTRLVINEFDLIGNGGNADRRERFLAFVKELREHGAPIDVIGFQAHFWSPKLTPPEAMWRIMDEVHAATGLPLMVSEFDMNLNDEALQADYTRDFLTAWYAHPAAEAYIMWGFWGGAHWMRDAGAMIRRDWTEKPNLRAYTDLVHGAWRTREALVTDENGTAACPAFYGTYQLTVRAPGHPELSRRWRHEPGGDEVWVQVFGPEAR